MPPPRAAGALRRRPLPGSAPVQRVVSGRPWLRGPQRLPSPGTARSGQALPVVAGASSPDATSRLLHETLGIACFFLIMYEPIYGFYQEAAAAVMASLVSFKKEAEA